MEGKELPIKRTGLENLSREKLETMMDEADQLGYSGDFPQGVISQELTRRSLLEQTKPSLLEQQKPDRAKKPIPVRERRTYSPIDSSWGMRGIGKNRGSR
ncbi:MAG: hypothetical protein WCV81_00465 [Microgenomates group bacterium]|jgi:hypothetical protein